MGKTMYNKIMEMITDLKKETDTIPNDRMVREIMVRIGSDPRTYKMVLMTMRSLNLIEEGEDAVKFR